MERALATIRKIDSIGPIEGADAIEVATIGGWEVVVKKNEFVSGQLVVYFEIDSWIPTELAPFLSKGKEPREYFRVKGERLRTIRLRGQLSQGLVLPIEQLFTTNVPLEGDDVTDLLNIQKWEPPATFSAANAKGNFPSFIPKTDQERIQNITRKIERWSEDDTTTFQVTEKLDGSSMTVYYKDSAIGVCSRNLELKLDEPSTFVDTAIYSGLVSRLTALGRNIAVQGELIGGSIQGNPYKIDGFQFFVFDIFDIDTGKYLTPQEVVIISEALCIQHVPVISYVTLYGKTTKDLLDLADGPSELNAKTPQEGFVYKMINGEDSFKTISNKWLLKNE